MYEGPEFRHLKNFIAVAEECNLGRAADRVRTTQPNLTRTLNQLEEGLNERLFDRGKAGSTLTAAGRAFMPFAREMLKLRAQSVKATSSKHSGIELPLRFGYSPFLNHDLVTTAMTRFCELVPEGNIEPTSECSGRLVPMVLRGDLEAALISLPVDPHGLFLHKLCSESLLVCLRADDALAALDVIPRETIADRLHIIVARVHHPLFYDKLIRKLSKAGIQVQPSSFVSAPSEMQYLVECRKGLGLVSESTPLFSKHLVTRPIEGVQIRMTTAFVCREAQQRPVLPLLAYSLAQHCKEPLRPIAPKKPSVRAESSEYLTAHAA